MNCQLHTPGQTLVKRKVINLTRCGMRGSGKNSLLPVTDPPLHAAACRFSCSECKSLGPSWHHAYERTACCRGAPSTMRGAGRPARRFSSAATGGASSDSCCAISCGVSAAPCVTHVIIIIGGGQQQNTKLDL